MEGCTHTNPLLHCIDIGLTLSAVNYTSACALLGRLKVEGTDGSGAVDVQTRATSASRTFVDDQLLRHKSVIDIEDRIAVRVSLG